MTQNTSAVAWIRIRSMVVPEVDYTNCMYGDSKVPALTLSTGSSMEKYYF